MFSGSPRVTSCYRCQGKVCENREWDLPKGVREYLCLNCGDRYWISLSDLHWVKALFTVHQN